jgi:hypothetical protein
VVCLLNNKVVVSVVETPNCIRLIRIYKGLKSLLLQPARGRLLLVQFHFRELVHLLLQLRRPLSFFFRKNPGVRVFVFPSLDVGSWVLFVWFVFVVVEIDIGGV